MPLGVEVGLGPGDFVLDVDPAPPPQKGMEPQIFVPCLLWPNDWMDQDGTWHGGRPAQVTVLDGVPASFALPNFRPISVVAKWLDASRCHLVWQ